MEKEYKILSFDANGFGVTYVNNKICFVKNALPNEVVSINIDFESKKCIFASVKEVIKKDSNRVDIDCKYYYKCGGCQLRHMTYDLEVKYKINKIINSFKYNAKEDIILNEFIKANNIYNYRNKAIINFQNINNEIIYGMYKEKSHDLISITYCLIEPNILKDILKITKEILEENNISIYNEITKKGLFRGVMLRVNYQKEIMLAFIVTQKINFDLFTSRFSKTKEIKSIHFNINDMNNNVMLSNNNILVYGNSTIKEKILDNYFDVSVNTFLQVNKVQTEKLYKLAINMLNLNKDDIVIDAYCGMGSITLNVAKHVSKIIGIEVVESSIKDANKNKEYNKINNAFFIQGKCEDVILNIVSKNNITKLIVDPPRKGCDKKFLDVILKSNIKNILYISCNVDTLARDYKILSSKYKIEQVCGVDLFPRTNHVESVVLLKHIKNSDK